MLILTNVFRSVIPTTDTTHIPTDGPTSKGINNIQIKQNLTGMFLSVSDIGRNIGSFVIPVYEGVVKDCWFPVTMPLTAGSRDMTLNYCPLFCCAILRIYFPCIFCLDSWVSIHDFRNTWHPGFSPPAHPMPMTEKELLNTI
jgi:hypothetical protein